MSNMAIESGDFRKVLGKYPTGVTLVSSKDDQGPFAMGYRVFRLRFARSTVSPIHACKGVRNLVKNQEDR